MAKKRTVRKTQIGKVDDGFVRGVKETPYKKLNDPKPVTVWLDAGPGTIRFKDRRKKDSGVGARKYSLPERRNADRGIGVRKTLTQAPKITFKGKSYSIEKEGRKFKIWAKTGTSSWTLVNKKNPLHEEILEELKARKKRR